MDYRAALRWLNSLQPSLIRPGLEHVRALLEALGNPERRFRSVLVGGTNGKGSVAAMLESVLRHEGWRTGLYASPHLVSVRERIRLGGRLVSPGEFAAAMAEIRSAASRLRMRPTYFEALTAAAFWIFARRRVDAAVVEVGMGGSWDATNVLSPLGSAVTGVDLDHTQWLGRTKACIARDKAGIARRGRPFVLGRCGREAFRAASAKARQAGAKFLYAPEARLPKAWRAEAMPLSLAGEHQRENRRTALALLHALRKELPVSAAALRQGLAAVRHPARLQKIGSRPVTFVDGAHNAEGMRALKRFMLSRPERPRALALAVSSDKDVAGMLRGIRGAGDFFIATQTPNPRLLRAGTLAARMRRADLKQVLVEGSPVRALEEARRLAGPRGLAVAAGSLYLAGEILKARMKKPPE